MAKMRLLANQGRRSREAQRDEETVSSQSLRSRENKQPNLKKCHLHTLLEECNTEKKTEFSPRRGEVSGEVVDAKCFSVLDTRFWQVPLHKQSAHVLIQQGRRCLLFMRTGSAMALMMEWPITAPVTLVGMGMKRTDIPQNIRQRKYIYA